MFESVLHIDSSVYFTFSIHTQYMLHILTTGKILPFKNNAIYAWLFKIIILH